MFQIAQPRSCLPCHYVFFFYTVVVQHSGSSNRLCFDYLLNGVPPPVYPLDERHR
jgi:hypothetical protein